MSTLSKRQKNKQIAARVFWWGLSAACAMLIFCLSHDDAAASSGKSSGLAGWLSAALGISVPPDFLRTLAHATEYAVLAGCLFFAFRSSRSTAKPYWAFLTAVLYAATDEIHQYFVPGRAFQLSDILVDAVGAAVSILLLMLCGKLISLLRARQKQ